MLHLEEVLQHLYNCEINITLTMLWDGGFDFALISYMERRLTISSHSSIPSRASAQRRGRPVERLANLQKRSTKLLSTSSQGRSTPSYTLARISIRLARSDYAFVGIS